MGFIYAVPEGMAGAAAATGALSAEAVGHAGQAVGAGAVVPPGLEEISAANAARIVEHAAHVASMLGLASGVQASNGASVGLSSGTYVAADAASAASVAAVI